MCMFVASILNRGYFNTTSLFRAREGLGKRRTGTRQGLCYSSWMVCGLYRDGGNLYSQIPSPLRA